MSQRRLCAHADTDGAGMHWLGPGEVCDRLLGEDTRPGVNLRSTPTTGR